MPTAHFHRETQMQEAVAMHVGAVSAQDPVLGSPIAAKRVQYRDMHWESSTWHPRMGRQHEPKVNTNQRSEEWKEPASSPGIGTSKW